MLSIRKQQTFILVSYDEPKSMTVGHDFSLVAKKTCELVTVI